MAAVTRHKHALNINVYGDRAAAEGKYWAKERRVKNGRHRAQALCVEFIYEL